MQYSLVLKNYFSSILPFLIVCLKLGILSDQHDVNIITFSKSYMHLRNYKHGKI